MSSVLLDKKLAYWEHQLLDLGKRNKMINYRETKRSTIKLVEPSFNDLFERLALNEESLTFQRSVDRETDIRVFSILSLLEHLSAPLPVTIGDIKTEGSVLDRQRTLKNMRSKSRLALEEQGTNILYLSFGFIEWKDGKGASTPWIKSPLILVPAVLALDALNSPYTLSKHEDDIVVNPTLEYFLKTEYGIELPHFDADKDSLDDFLQSIEEIADQRGWRILREVSLGLLSFLKITMYNDLLQNEARIKKNAVIRAMAGDADDANTIPESLRSYNLDSIKTQDCYQVMNADSSQQDAILYSKNNISFVMQGPPGTGKSQTITNIIAEALADGKKVLFVSEKMAALQVVYRRLEEAHLSDFCLPLHSYKANKKEILEQIGANLKLKQTRVKDTALTNLEELLVIRQELNKYAAELHQTISRLNMSCYEVYGKLEEVNDAPAVSFAFRDPFEITHSELQFILNTLKEYSLSLARLGYFIKNNPWEGLTTRISGYNYAAQMQSEIETVLDNITFLTAQLNAFVEIPNLSEWIAYSSLTEFAGFAEQICSLPKIPVCWIGNYDFSSGLKIAQNAKKQCVNMSSLRAEIGNVFYDAVYQYDYNLWRSELSAKAESIASLPLIALEEPTQYIDRASTLTDVFTAIYDKLHDAKNVFDAINAQLGTDYTPTLQNQTTLSALLSLLETNILLNETWLRHNTDISQIKNMVDDAQQISAHIKNIKENILHNWKPEFFDLNYAPILMRYRTEYRYFFREFESPLIPDPPAEANVSQLSILIEVLNDIYNSLKTAEDVFDSANYLLGTDFAVNEYSQHMLIAIFDLLNPNIPLNSKWFDYNADISKIKSLAEEAASTESELKKCKENILQNWEHDILSLDYAPILLRYKTEYTGLFKMFKSQYKKDQKQLRALSKVVVKKIPDNVAVEILGTLKLYHEKTQWFEEKNDELQSLIGELYVGIDSNWEMILKALSIADKLKSLPLKAIPTNLIAIASFDHAEQTAKLNADLDMIGTAFAKVKSHAVANRLAIDMDSSEFDLRTTYALIDSYINTLTKVIQNNKCDRDLIGGLAKTIATDCSDEGIFGALSTLDQYHNSISAFAKIRTSLSEHLGVYDNGIESDWGLILNALDIANEIINLFHDEIPAKLVSILSTDRPTQTFFSEANLIKAGEALTTIYNLAEEKCIAINSTSADFDLKSTLKTVEAYLSGLAAVSSQMELLSPYLKSTNMQIETVDYAIGLLNSYDSSAKAFAEISNIYKEQFEHLFAEESTDWDPVIDLLKKVDTAKQSPIFARIIPIINIPAERKQELSMVSKRIIEGVHQGSASFDWVCHQFSTSTPLQALPMSVLTEKISGCLKHIDKLGCWIDYQEAKEACQQNDLSDFTAKIEYAEIYENIDRAFLKGFYHLWLGVFCDKSDAVRRFRRNTHDERIQKFIELDEMQLLIAQMRIREKLIENLPSTNRMLKATDEVAILNKELSKKRKIMPLRKLFRQIPNLLMTLKPCLMMSPLSVSYFLETEAYHFDLVIFDEASQIFPEDAIGAIFRGSQVIIAGDSKQLPPTNFFSATTNNFDGDYDLNDNDEDFGEVVSDSILEESASALPNRTLLWHYRSKNESLIAFSNREIYKNNLITFPNSINNVPDMGVEYIYVPDGFYEGSGKNCNIREAQKCVMLVLKHIQQYPERSLGVIAFSEKQQAAIENAIIDFRERMPQYEWFFDESKEEPFFVKNLENVQGDERDTIIFSICYAKDRNGKMYMRFGPLGHEGGERRLNVAITRAKCNVKLVGSILPSDIDLNRTNSEGVRMLRSYIDFARKGTSVLKPIEKEEAFETTDEFCNVIAAFLEKNGYDIQRNVGCSDYKIDIAIKNPKSAEEYIAGIECDGLSYIHAKTARDRDHLRKTVLENMGWNLYRIWSTEWSRNPKSEGEALLSFVASLFDQSGNVIHDIKQSNDNETSITIEEIASETVKSVKKEANHNPYDFAYYQEANWWETKHSGSSDNLTRISENIVHIVNIEQPMHMELLYKRMGPSFTTGKATGKVKNAINIAIKNKLANRVVIDKDNFIRLLPLGKITVRIPKEFDTPRPIEYIHTEEIALAMIQIIRHSFGITEEDLSTECAKAFGFERKGAKIKVKTDAAIKYLVESRIIKIIDGKAQLIGERV